MEPDGRSRPRAIENFVHSVTIVETCKAGLRQTPRVSRPIQSFGSLPSYILSEHVLLMPVPQIPIGHINWVKSYNVWFTGFLPNIRSSPYRTTQPSFPLNTAAIQIRKFQSVCMQYRTRSNATTWTAHGANHIRTSRLADAAVNYPCGESPNRSVGRTVRTISPSVYAMSQDSNLPPRSRNTKRLFRLWGQLRSKFT